jgi:DNA-binding transcriptional ArsR family regulator
MSRRGTGSTATGVTNETAERVAELMQVLATASRVRLLAQLRAGSRTVGELTQAAEMNQSAVSQQLRVSAISVSSSDAETAARFITPSTMARRRFR